MESERLKRVSSLLEQDLAQIFIGFAKKYFKGTLLSVTRVRVSPDLSVARVCVSLFPLKEKELAMEILHKHAFEIKNELASRTRHQLRKMPDLSYFLDDSLDYEENIDRLLRGEGENPIL